MSIWSQKDYKSNNDILFKKGYFYKNYWALVEFY